MIENIYDIKTPFWQKKRNSIGETVKDLDDIEQCYNTIINTIKGEIPFQPNIGTNIFEAIGQKPQNALEIITTIIKEEFSIQEPRGEIVSITSNYDTNGKIEINVIFKGKNSEEERTTKYYV